MRASTEWDFQAYSRPLNSVTYFNYLDQILLASADNWRSVMGNLGKARKISAQLSRILVREGGNQRVTGIFSRRWCRWYLFLGQRHQ